jgi:hypothetical protein
MVYCPRKNTNGIWRNLDECVWDGPRFLITVEPLKIHYDYDKDLSTFFSVVLEIRNYSIQDVLNELAAIKDMADLPTNEKLRKAVEIYKFLDGSDYDFVRNFNSVRYVS